jgi:acetylornithine deacetylase/succinyl-diaminopimelate desuccinylase-like protein
MCSLKNVEARDYLLSTLNELANQTKNLFVSSDDFGNVLSVLEGSNGPDNALLVSSHYDTVLLSPGTLEK